MSEPNDAARLLPPNATALERALVQAAARAADIPVPIPALWNVDTCPAALLPWLAWALAVEVWRSDWPEAVKRQRIRASVNVHRRKGTAASVREVVASFGANLALREWWQQTPPGAPHTFDVTLSIAPNLPQDATFQGDVITAIEQTKPARSHFVFSVAQQLSTAVGVIAATHAVTYARINLME